MVNQPMRLAEWIEANLPPGERVGVHDCGAMRYYGAHPIYDLVGLTAPSVVPVAWRQGSGSMYEAMERTDRPPAFFAVPDEAWTLPYLAKAGLFGRELFRVEHPDRGGVTAASGRQVVYTADWRWRNGGNRLYQENVLEIVKGLAFVDAVDIADLASESDHRYRYWAAPGGRTGPSEVYRLTYPVPPHAEAVDGGRMLSGGEAFDLRTRPGEDLVLIGRFMGMNEVWLQVRVNGAAVGWLYYPAFAGAWQERALRVPASYITAPKTRVEILADNQRPGFEWHRPFYYWAFQGNLAAHEPPMAHPLDAIADGAIRLLGYDLELTKGASAARLKVTLYWRAEQPIQSDLKVFVHWVDGQDRILTQRDSRPRQEAQPTWTWQPGFVVDPYELELASALPSLSAIYVGLYDAQNMAKHPLSGSDAAGRLCLTSLTNP